MNYEERELTRREKMAVGIDAADQIREYADIISDLLKESKDYPEKLPAEIVTLIDKFIGIKIPILCKKLKMIVHDHSIMINNLPPDEPGPRGEIGTLTEKDEGTWEHIKAIR